MNAFEYVRPATVRDAVAAALHPGATYLAGGTNLLDLMKGNITRPARLVDISRLPDLDRIEYLPHGSVRIGALVRNADLAHDGNFARRYPAVAEALLSGASAQLRNAATVGGSAQGVPISATSRAPATNASQARAATHVAAITGFTPFWGGTKTASQHIRLISACPWSRLTRSSRCRAELDSARFPSRLCTGCLAIRQTARPCLNLAKLSSPFACRPTQRDSRLIRAI